MWQTIFQALGFLFKGSIPSNKETLLRHFQLSSAKDFFTGNRSQFISELKWGSNFYLDSSAAPLPTQHLPIFLNIFFFLLPLTQLHSSGIPSSRAIYTTSNTAQLTLNPSIMVRLPFRPRRGGLGRGHPRNETTSDTDLSKNFPENDTFYPKIWDVLKVKYLLQWKLKEGFPVELVDQIIDAAEYWPSIERRMGEGPKIIRQDRDEVLLKTVPLCYDRKASSFPTFEAIGFTLLTGFL